MHMLDGNILRAGEEYPRRGFSADPPPKIYGECTCCGCEIEEGDEIRSFKSIHGELIDFCAGCASEYEIGTLEPDAYELTCLCCGKTVSAGERYCTAYDSRSRQEYDLCFECFQNTVWRAER